MRQFFFEDSPTAHCSDSVKGFLKEELIESLQCTCDTCQKKTPEHVVVVVYRFSKCTVQDVSLFESPQGSCDRALEFLKGSKRVVNYSIPLVSPFPTSRQPSADEESRPLRNPPEQRRSLSGQRDHRRSLSAGRPWELMQQSPILTTSLSTTSSRRNSINAGERLPPLPPRVRQNVIVQRKTASLVFSAQEDTFHRLSVNVRSCAFPECQVPRLVGHPYCGVHWTVGAGTQTGKRIGKERAIENPNEELKHALANLELGGKWKEEAQAMESLRLLVIQHPLLPALVQESTMDQIARAINSHLLSTQRTSPEFHTIAALQCLQGMFVGLHKRLDKYLVNLVPTLVRTLAKAASAMVSEPPGIATPHQRNRSGAEGGSGSAGSVSGGPGGGVGASNLPASNLVHPSSTNNSFEGNSLSDSGAPASTQNLSQMDDKGNIGDVAPSSRFSFVPTMPPPVSGSSSSSSTLSLTSPPANATNQLGTTFVGTTNSSSNVGNPNLPGSSSQCSIGPATPTSPLSSAPLTSPHTGNLHSGARGGLASLLAFQDQLAREERDMREKQAQREIEEREEEILHLKNASTDFALAPEEDEELPESDSEEDNDEPQSQEPPALGEAAMNTYGVMMAYLSTSRVLKFLLRTLQTSEASLRAQAMECVLGAVETLGTSALNPYCLSDIVQPVGLLLFDNDEAVVRAAEQCVLSLARHAVTAKALSTLLDVVRDKVHGQDRDRFELLIRKVTGGKVTQRGRTSLDRLSKAVLTQPKPVPSTPHDPAAAQREARVAAIALSVASNSNNLDVASLAETAQDAHLDATNSTLINLATNSTTATINSNTINPAVTNLGNPTANNLAVLNPASTSINLTTTFDPTTTNPTTTSTHPTTTSTNPTDPIPIGLSIDPAGSNPNGTNPREILTHPPVTIPIPNLAVMVTDPTNPAEDTMTNHLVNPVANSSGIDRLLDGPPVATASANEDLLVPGASAVSDMLTSSELDSKATVFDVHTNRISDAGSALPASIAKHIPGGSAYASPSQSYRSGPPSPACETTINASRSRRESPKLVTRTMPSPSPSIVRSLSGSGSSARVPISTPTLSPSSTSLGSLAPPLLQGTGPASSSSSSTTRILAIPACEGTSQSIPIAPAIDPLPSSAFAGGDSLPASISSKIEAKVKPPTKRILRRSFTQGPSRLSRDDKSKERKKPSKKGSVRDQMMADIAKRAAVIPRKKASQKK